MLLTRIGFKGSDSQSANPILFVIADGILRYFFRRRSATTNHTNCRYSGTLPRRCGVEYNSFVPSRSRAILVTSYH
uniref:Uncharacterized protein n=1 Tax=Leersia perrieri TaxID=77586 RepID=A0A0D9WNN5_9ORYZ